MLRSLAENSCTPSEVLTKLNRLLVEDFPSGRFVTMVYAVLDPSKGTLTYANAGHLSPLLVDATGARFLETEMELPLEFGLGRSRKRRFRWPTKPRSCSTATASLKLQIREMRKMDLRGWRRIC